MKMFPIQQGNGYRDAEGKMRYPKGFRVPWEFAEKAFKTYDAGNYHQDMETLAKRGGFDLLELSFLYCGIDPFRLHGQIDYERAFACSQVVIADLLEVLRYELRYEQ